jgi:hypothetical protein
MNLTIFLMEEESFAVNDNEKSLEFAAGVN